MSNITIDNKNDVLLHCVKISGKLRVRILSPDFLNNANCQFPRDLRIQGRKFVVSKHDINLITTRGKYYYSISKSSVKQMFDGEIQSQTTIDMSNFKIFQDEQETECCVCLCNEKNSIFFPCGHYVACNECAKMCHQCPICRASVMRLVSKSEMG